MPVITKHLDIELNYRLVKYYRSKGYKLSNFILAPKPAKIKVKFKDVHTSCEQHIEYECDACGEINTTRIRNLYRAGKSLYSRIGKTLCSKCATSFRTEWGMDSNDQPCYYCGNNMLNKEINSRSTCILCYKMQKALGGADELSEHLKKIKNNN